VYRWLGHNRVVSPDRTSMHLIRSPYKAREEVPWWEQRFLALAQAPTTGNTAPGSHLEDSDAEASILLRARYCQAHGDWLDPSSSPSANSYLRNILR
jgi:hypothetical protein